MTTRNELRDFEDTIYELVDTDEWEKIEEKMDTDNTFLTLLLTHVDFILATEKAWRVRIRITHKTHPNENERLVAEESSLREYLELLDKQKNTGYEVRRAFLGEDGLKESEQRLEELMDAWSRASRAGLI